MHVLLSHSGVWHKMKLRFTKYEILMKLTGSEKCVVGMCGGSLQKV
jgi:hypothetical protein